MNNIKNLKLMFLNEFGFKMQSNDHQNIVE